MAIFISVWLGGGIVNWVFWLFESRTRIYASDIFVILPVALFLGPLPLIAQTISELFK